MSAYIVRAETINRVVNAALYVVERLGPSQDSAGVSDAQRFGESLYQMNSDAVFQRYGERDELEPWTFTAEPVQDTPQSLMAHAKAVSCLNYQCTEGDVPERPLYAFLDQIERALVTLAAAHYPPNVTRAECWHVRTQEWNDAKTWE